jgi:hypothetical protein
MLLIHEAFIHSYVLEILEKILDVHGIIGRFELYLSLPVCHQLPSICQAPYPKKMPCTAPNPKETPLHTSPLSIYVSSLFLCKPISLSKSSHHIFIQATVSQSNSSASPPQYSPKSYNYPHSDTVYSFQDSYTAVHTAHSHNDTAPQTATAAHHAAHKTYRPNGPYTTTSP